MDNDLLGKKLKPGANHYRAFVGEAVNWDTMAANQFTLMTELGLREHHKLLDVGCGSLRAGRLFIPYLLPGNYYGLEPNMWLVDEARKEERVYTKESHFDNNTHFNLKVFKTQFNAILAQSVITHATLKQTRVLFNNISRVLTLRGLAVLSCHLREKDWEGTEWQYPGTHGFKLETLQEIAKNNNMTCKQLHYQHPEGCEWVILQLNQQ